MKHKYSIFCLFKRFIIIVFLFGFIVNAHAQFDEKETIQQNLLDSQAKYKQGKTFTIIGCITVAGGGLLLATSSWNCSPGVCSSNQPQSFLGGLCIITGFAIGTKGIITKVIAKKRIRQYNQILENMSLKLNQGNDAFSFQLVYRF